MSNETCCTCALFLDRVQCAGWSEKEQSQEPRHLDCCQRVICGRCIKKRPQFATYCPFCQLTEGPSPLPQGLRDPPSYSASSSKLLSGVRPDNGESMEDDDRHPPAYTENDPRTSSNIENQPDIVHYLRPSDTIASLSLAYSIPSSSLRSHNSLYSDHLLAARKTISIPASLYQGPSLSSHPIESEEEMERKSNLRRFMVRTKCHEYDIAELYLKQANNNLENAIEAWTADENWEKNNPLKSSRKGGAPQRSRKPANSSESGLTGQLR